MRGHRGPAYARTTITVPMKLKRRMKALGNEVNWSSIACAAFEARLNELTSETEVDSLDAVIDRLKRFSTAETVRDSDAFESGGEEGKRWAMSAAAPGQLQRFEDFRNQHDEQQWKNFLQDEKGWRALAGCLDPDMCNEGGGPRRGGPGRRGRSAERGPGRGSQGEGGPRPRRGMRARRTWMMILDEWPDHTDFFPGFVEGALEVWRSVKDRL